MTIRILPSLLLVFLLLAWGCVASSDPEASTLKHDAQEPNTLCLNCTPSLHDPFTHKAPSQGSLGGYAFNLESIDKVPAGGRFKVQHPLLTIKPEQIAATEGESHFIKFGLQIIHGYSAPRELMYEGKYYELESWYADEYKEALRQVIAALSDENHIEFTARVDTFDREHRPAEGEARDIKLDYIRFELKVGLRVPQEGLQLILPSIQPQYRECGVFQDGRGGEWRGYCVEAKLIRKDEVLTQLEIANLRAVEE